MNYLFTIVQQSLYLPFIRFLPLSSDSANFYSQVTPVIASSVRFGLWISPFIIISLISFLSLTTLAAFTFPILAIFFVLRALFPTLGIIFIGIMGLSLVLLFGVLLLLSGLAALGLLIINLLGSYF